MAIVIRFFFTAKYSDMNLHDLIKSPSATIVDVRTAEEFHDGHVPHSINIPLDTIAQQIDRLKGLSKPIILCCRSGNRSNQALTQLKANGCNQVFDGGPWKDVYLHRL